MQQGAHQCQAVVFVAHMQQVEGSVTIPPVCEVDRFLCVKLIQIFEKGQGSVLTLID